MITYKGDRLVKGKRFMEGTSRVLTYKGKVFGDHYLFDDRGVDIILNEYEVSKLEDYQILKEHSLIEEQEDSNDLYQLVTSYTDEQIKIINGPSKNMWNDLHDSFQKELNDFNDRGLSYKVSYNQLGVDNPNESYILEVIKDYLEESQRNISNISLPNHYVQLSNFIYNIDRMRGDK